MNTGRTSPMPPSASRRLNDNQRAAIANTIVNRVAWALIIVMNTCW